MIIAANIEINDMRGFLMKLVDFPLVLRFKVLAQQE